MKNIRIKYKHLYWVMALFAAVIFDRLFWDKPWGINFFIFVALAVLGGLIPMWAGKIAIPWTSYVLLFPTALFAAFTFIRSEPLTTLMNGLLAFGFMILFTISLRNGEWLNYDFKDHILNFLKFLLNCLIGGVLFFVNIFTRENKSDQPHNNPDQQEPPQVTKKNKPWRAYLRGVLLALPVIILLTLLLASADAVFSARIQGLFDWFEFDNLGEYLFRTFYIVVIAYLLLSAYFFGLAKSGTLHKETQTGSQVRPFLGMIEAGIVLGAVNLLFLSFVLIQFTYFFGGDQNVSIQGFTYAEYARRGFFELLAVAVISSFLFYILSQITARKAKPGRWIFTGLGLMLVALVGIILVSAYTRLTLYEEAYGFTRLRTFTHVFIIWTGGALLTLGILEVTQKLQRLPVFLIFWLMLFGLTINILNVDSFIVRQNVQRGITEHPASVENQLDIAYLSELSFDATPPLIAYYLDDSLPTDLRMALGGVLACRLETRNQPDQIPWTSWHYARSKANVELKNIEGGVSDYRVYQSEDPWGWFVEINQMSYPCNIPWD